MQIIVGLSNSFWVEVVNSAFYVTNGCIIRSILKKIRYDMLFKIKPKPSYFSIFGCKCFMLNNGKDDLGNFYSESDEGIFVDYSSTRKTAESITKELLC